MQDPQFMTRDLINAVMIMQWMPKEHHKSIMSQGPHEAALVHTPSAVI